MSSVGTAGLVVGCIGLAMMVGAGGAYIAVTELRPPKVIGVPMPIVPTPSFGPVPHITVNSIPAPTPTATPEPAPAAVEKSIVKPKPPVKRVVKKTKAQRQFEKRWSNVKR